MNPTVNKIFLLGALVVNVMFTLGTLAHDSIQTEPLGYRLFPVLAIVNCVVIGLWAITSFLDWATSQDLED